MVTIAHITEKIIEQKPFIQEALSKGIINNAALAEEIKPEIEKELKKKVKFSAVNMAIRRLSEKLKNSFVSTAKFNKDSDIVVRSDLIEITFFKTENTQSYLKKVYDVVDFNNGDFLTITQGLYEIMIIINKKHEKKLLNIFPKNSIKKIISCLSSITINIPVESINELGLFYIVTRSLNWNNIVIVDIVSTLTEMTFIINERDVPISFNVLKKLIELNRKIKD